MTGIANSDGRVGFEWGPVERERNLNDLYGKMGEARRWAEHLMDGLHVAMLTIPTDYALVAERCEGVCEAIEMYELARDEYGVELRGEVV